MPTIINRQVLANDVDGTIAVVSTQAAQAQSVIDSQAIARNQTNNFPLAAYGTRKDWYSANSLNKLRGDIFSTVYKEDKPDLRRIHICSPGMYISALHTRLLSNENNGQLWADKNKTAEVLYFKNPDSTVKHFLLCFILSTNVHQAINSIIATYNQSISQSLEDDEDEELAAERQIREYFVSFATQKELDDKLSPLITIHQFTGTVAHFKKHVLQDGLGRRLAKALDPALKSFQKLCDSSRYGHPIIFRYLTLTFTPRTIVAAALEDRNKFLATYADLEKFIGQVKADWVEATTKTKNETQDWLKNEPVTVRNTAVIQLREIVLREHPGMQVNFK
jgi:hypothetical protein